MKLTFARRKAEACIWNITGRNDADPADPKRSIPPANNDRPAEYQSQEMHHRNYAHNYTNNNK